MGLPKLSVPTFHLTIPSSKKKVKYRPFLSGEEKILMLVKKSEDGDMILQAMKDIIEVCLFKKVDVDKLSIFDIEYIFLQLRSKSVGEIIDIDMKCNNELEIDVDIDIAGEPQKKTKPCGGLVPFVININEIHVATPEEHSNVIMLEDNIGITLRYPSVDDLKMMDVNEDNDVEIIKNLLENIFDGDSVYDVSDTSEAEIDDFMANMNSKQIAKIREKFFYNMPYVEHTAKYKCSKCGYEGEYVFRGINDFF